MTDGSDNPFAAPGAGWAPPPPTPAPEFSPWGGEPGFGPYTPSPPEKRRKWPWIALAVGLVALAIAGTLGMGALINLRTMASPNRPVALPSGALGAASPLTVHSGTVVFHDDFARDASGWRSGKIGHAHYGWLDSAYEIRGVGAYHFMPTSPYRVPQLQLMQSVTATVAAGAPPTGGFGLTCARNVGRSGELRYEFVVNESGRWLIERRDGVPRPGSGPSTILRAGDPVPDLTTSLTVSAACITMADRVTTRLDLFVNDVRVAEVLDTSTATQSGWIGELLASGGNGGPVLVRFTGYQEARLP